MRILRLYYLLPPIKGGMEKHIYNLSKFQSKYNEVSVFFNQGDPISSNDKKIFPLIKFYKIRPLFIGVFVFYISIILKLIFDRKRFDVIIWHECGRKNEYYTSIGNKFDNGTSRFICSK